MFSAEHEQNLRRLRFPDDVERAFQRDYYARHRTMARITLWCLAFVSATLVIIAISRGQYALSLVPLLASSANGWLLWRLYHEPYVRSWQPLGMGSFVFVECAALCCLFFQNADLGITNVLGIAICILALSARRYLRLQKRWVLPLYLATLIIISSWNYLIDAKQSTLAPPSTFTTRISEDSMVSPDNPDIETFQGPPKESSTLASNLTAAFFLAILFALEWWLSGRNERHYRREFLEVYLLERERDEERDKRQHTETMLHVLSQAIGSIVHDLGNPLTNVQTGAQTLRYFVEDGEADRQTVLEFTDIILDGAQMLNYLRLSLMEQTRVLENKPIPVKLAPTSLRRIAEAGAQYQKPKFIAGRTIEMPEDDVELLADEMKLVTVFMNLIGNALKYSDGPVRIVSKTHNDTVLIGVVDQGKDGRGIARAQAQQLFVPFGRLDTHSNIEGTGLGLLSVRAIAQAHNGEIYIEGREDGTPSSQPFSTANGSYPTLLNQDDCTAFVLACPLSLKKTPVKSLNAQTRALAEKTASPPTKTPETALINA